ncbi:protein RRP5 homolog [Teleopsis dalmanni]|uniref:protein RRP5 homolog n=1 Tax=Teleopsis dalmanni TaxID=139649 RepID=UPI0018CDD5AB|nr:protein RRP5 homolog [Teleopsis dalmanni]
MGEICPATVVNNLDSGLEIKIEYDEEANETSYLKGLVPIRLLSDFNDLLLAQMNIHPPNSDLQICCVNKNIFSLRDVEYFLQNCTKTWGTVKIGDILKATIKNVAENVIEIMLPIKNFNKLVKLHKDMLLINVYNNPNIILTEEQPLYVKVLSKEESTKTITVSGKLTDVWDGLLNSTSEYIEKYLDERESIRNAYKNLKHPIAKYVLGDRVSASFVGVYKETNEWQYELVDTKLKAIVPASMVVNKKVPEKGYKQECIVLWIDYSSEHVWISNKQADLKHISRNSELPTNLVGQSDINAKVLLKQESVFICSLKKGNQPLIVCPSHLHYNDFENCGSINVQEQSFCKLNFIRNTKPIAVLESTYKLFSTKPNKKRINSESNEAPSKKKIKKHSESEEVVTERISKETKKKKLIEKSEIPAKKSKSEKKSVTLNTNNESNEKNFTDPGSIIRFVNDAKWDAGIVNNISIINENKELKKKTAKKSCEKEPSKLEIKTETKTILKKQDNASETSIEDNALFFIDKSPDDRYVRKLEQNSKPKEKLSLPGIDNFWNMDLSNINNSDKTVSSDEDDEATSEIPQKKKKLTATEKFKQEREEEARLRIIEEKYANPDQIPETVDQFDRLVMSDPNNTKHWISYMVFHLQETEIDKARAVAQRAIKTIPFRNLNERLNIWMALLNLELHYGTKETYDNTMKEALTCNDPMQIHLRSLEILKDSNNRQELFEIISIITKKYKTEPEAWKAVAIAYFSIDMPERAQQMLQKSLLSLPEREHVNTIVMFANLNHKYNKNEIAQTLLEQVVTSYPKRVDVWTQYVDMLVKDNLIDSARSILERAVMQKIPLKKMRTLFKKYLTFEEQYGTEENQKRVKNLAAEYVKNSTTL